jgi:hypothetical protein
MTVDDSGTDVLEMSPKTQKRTTLVRYLRSVSDPNNAYWRSYSDDEELFVREFPKIELHVHLDGSFDPDFLWRYMEQHPEILSCLPVETKVPWDPSTKLEVRSMVQKCETPQDYHS